MKIHQSILGAILSVLYLAGAIYVVQDELRYTGGGWINLRGLATAVVTLPSQVTFGYLFEALGVPRVNYAEPGFAGYSQLAVHIIATALFVYLIGFGLEWVLRRVLRTRTE